ncbi:MAG TPA: sensor histidine kinase [Dyadobacter sp.]|nr:sensor histidine kinase [Dyadobacter sp.]
MVHLKSSLPYRLLNSLCPKNSDRYWSRVVFFSLISNIFIVTNAFAFQDKPNTKNPYVRLLETTKDYNLAVQKGDSADIAENCYLLGKRYIAVGDYTEAQTWLLKALGIREQIGAYEDIGKIYTRMQEIQIILKTSENSILYARKALFNFQKAGDRKGLMTGYTTMGTSFLQMFEISKSNSSYSAPKYALDSAIYYFKKSNTVAISLGIRIDIAENYRNLASAYKFKGNIDQYENYLIRAASIFKSENYKRNDLHLSLDAVSTYLDRSNFKEARKWLMNAERLVAYPEITDNLKHSFQIVRARYLAYGKNWDKAYFLLHSAYQTHAQNAQLNGIQSVKNVRKIYEGELKEIELKARKNEIGILQSNAQTQAKLTWAIALILALAILATVFFAILYKKYLSVSKYNALLIREQSHRTKNDLQSVCDLLSLQLFEVQDDATTRILQESLLRVESMTMVHHKLYQDNNLAKIQLDQYIRDLVQSVLKVYKKQHVSVNFDILPCWLGSEKAVSFGLILNELTTNACKYGLDSYDAQIDIICEENEGRIHFSFADNGPGADSITANSGFGINLITMLTSQLKAAGHFEIKEGFSYTLFIPNRETKKTINKGTSNDGSQNQIHEYAH